MGDSLSYLSNVLLGCVKTYRFSWYLTPVSATLESLRHQFHQALGSVFSFARGGRGREGRGVAASPIRTGVGETLDGQETAI